jgi:hypothetical protein
MISTTLHQIWLGPPPPDWVRASFARWDAFMAEHHPDWQIRRWTDPPGGLDPRVMPWAACDLLRLKVLEEHGGVYTDCDVIPLRPLDRLAGDRPAWVGRPPVERWSGICDNAILGFPPGHPLPSLMWDATHKVLESARPTPGTAEDYRLRGACDHAHGDVLRDHPDLADELDFEWFHPEQNLAVTDDALREKLPGQEMVHVQAMKFRCPCLPPDTPETCDRPCIASWARMPEEAAA